MPDEARDPKGYQGAADFPLGAAHGAASTYGRADGVRCCDFCGFPVDEDAVSDEARELVPVTQEDRDAAANLAEWLQSMTNIGGNDIAAIRNGFWDQDTDDLGPLVQAFARHRLAALSTRPASTGEEVLAEKLFHDLKHGDEDHQAWLREAILASLLDRPIPEPRGQGRKEARIAELEALLEGSRPASTGEEVETFLDELSGWEQAYPLRAFPEPDLKKAAEVLKAAGMTLDSISASNMRHVVSCIAPKARAAIAALTVSTTNSDDAHV